MRSFTVTKLLSLCDRWQSLTVHMPSQGEALLGGKGPSLQINHQSGAMPENDLSYQDDELGARGDTSEQDGVAKRRNSNACKSRLGISISISAH